MQLFPANAYLLVEIHLSMFHILRQAELQQMWQIYLSLPAQPIMFTAE